MIKVIIDVIFCVSITHLPYLVETDSLGHTYNTLVVFIYVLFFGNRFQINQIWNAKLINVKLVVSLIRHDLLEIR